MNIEWTGTCGKWWKEKERGKIRIFTTHYLSGIWSCLLITKFWLNITLAIYQYIIRSLKSPTPYTYFKLHSIEHILFTIYCILVHLIVVKRQGIHFSHWIKIHKLQLKTLHELYLTILLIESWAEYLIHDRNIKTINLYLRWRKKWLHGSITDFFYA